jgi:hypothetical protein
VIEKPHAMAGFADALVALAEGRTEPADWLSWWAEHAASVEAVCPRGWYLRLVPKAGDGPLRTEQAVLWSQGGACYVLDKLGVSVERSARYIEVYEAEFARWERAERAERKQRAAELKPHIDALATDFPRMARFLRYHRDEIESMRPGASEAELDELARTSGVPLPAAYRTFLSHTRELVVGDTLRLTEDHPFVHTSTKAALPTEGMVCFGEYWAEADGDQVLFDPCGGDDPPVLYYAHGRRTVERAAASFTQWIESLPRALSSGG